MLIFLILIFQKYNIMITEDKKKMQLKQAKKNVNQKKKKKNSVFLFFHQVTSPSNSSHLPRYMYLYSLVFQLLL